MPRPQKKRSIRTPPLFSAFKPAGVRRHGATSLQLALDEFEAIRLADHQGLDHAESAALMGISRSTFSRLVEKARHTVAQLLVEGRCLEISGGEVHFEGNMIRCRDCGYTSPVDFVVEPKECPSCGSTDLIDFAGGFGHGRCCWNHHHRRSGEEQG